MAALWLPTRGRLLRRSYAHGVTSSGEAPSQLSGLEIADADIPLLVDVWLSSLEAVADLAGSLTQAQWQTASPCPGWSAGDVVAHVLALESEFHGDPYPQHQPDWGSLPHASTPVGRYMEAVSYTHLTLPTILLV